jgi:hypothetical protein
MVLIRRLASGLAEDEPNRNVGKKEKQEDAAFDEGDAVEVQEVHLVLRDAEQRSIKAIHWFAGQEIDGDPDEQKQISKNEAAEEDLGGRVEEGGDIRAVDHRFTL